MNDFNGIQAATFVGLKNYIQLFTADPIFIKTLLNTTLFVLMGMGIGPSLGMLTALMLNQKVRYHSVFRTAYYLPVMTSLVVVSTIWIMLYNHNGLLTAWYRAGVYQGRLAFRSPRGACFGSPGQCLAGLWL